MPNSNDVVASWEVPLSDGVHMVEFEHGTTTGKRVIRVDGKEIMRQDWMFKLVGSEVFTIGSGSGQARCIVKVEPVGGFSFAYELEVNGKSYEKFTEARSRVAKTWLVNLPESSGDAENPQQFRVVLGTVPIIERSHLLTRDSLFLLTLAFITAEKDTLDIWANGQKLEATGEFVEDGTETHFSLGPFPAYIKTVSSGNRREGLIHSLIVNERVIPEATE